MASTQNPVIIPADICKEFMFLWENRASRDEQNGYISAPLTLRQPLPHDKAPMAAYLAAKKDKMLWENYDFRFDFERGIVTFASETDMSELMDIAVAKAKANKCAICIAPAPMGRLQMRSDVEADLKWKWLKAKIEECAHMSAAWRAAEKKTKKEEVKMVADQQQQWAADAWLQEQQFNGNAKTAQARRQGREAEKKVAVAELEAYSAAVAMAGASLSQAWAIEWYAVREAKSCIAKVAAAHAQQALLTAAREWAEKEAVEDHWGSDDANSVYSPALEEATRLTKNVKRYRANYEIYAKKCLRLAGATKKWLVESEEANSAAALVKEHRTRYPHTRYCIGQLQ